MEHRNTMKGKGNKKSEIVQYLFEHKNTSKTEMTKALNISMPTVLQNTKELIEQGILIEVGEYESTGGRRAKTLALNGDAAYTVGLDITTDHINFVLLNLRGEILKHAGKEKSFTHSLDYYREVSEEMERFLDVWAVDRSRILGVGIALPGIINDEENALQKMLLKSHVLKLEGISLKIIDQFFAYPVHFENDANAALIAESDRLEGDAIYLFLSNTVGAAFCVNGNLFVGNNRKAGEAGHMIVVPNGRECYCGKKGCVNTYCSVLAIKNQTGLSLEEFMEQVAEGCPAVMKVWDEFLEYLSITISNLRMMYDTDIILGGDMGAYLENYMFEIGKRLMKYNKDDIDISYLKNTTYKKGGAAAGAARYFIMKYIREIS